MLALHLKDPRKGAPTEADRRAAAHARRHNARRALQQHMRDRAAVPERRHATNRPSAAAGRLHLVRVGVKVEDRAEAGEREGPRLARWLELGSG